LRQGRSSRAPLIAGHGPLAKVSPLLAFIAVVGLFTAGVLVRGVLGAALLGLLAAGVAVLLAATWQALSPGHRFGRVLVLAVLVAVAFSVL
jgi:hypothetical protein